MRTKLSNTQTIWYPTFKSCMLTSLSLQLAKANGYSYWNSVQWLLRLFFFTQTIFVSNFQASHTISLIQTRKKAKKRKRKKAKSKCFFVSHRLNMRTICEFSSGNRYCHSGDNRFGDRSNEVSEQFFPVHCYKPQLKVTYLYVLPYCGPQISA